MDKVWGHRHESNHPTLVAAHVVSGEQLASSSAYRSRAWHGSLLGPRCPRLPLGDRAARGGYGRHLHPLSGKPLQNIADVKIIDMGGGLPGGSINGVGKGGRMDALVDSLLAYRANAPVIDQLLTEAGFPNNGGLVSTLLGATTGTDVRPKADGMSQE